MNTKKLMTMLSLLLGASVYSHSQQALEPGTYFIQNAVSGTYLSSGANWGTRCVLAKHGVDIKVEKVGDGYSLVTDLQGAGKALRPSDAYMDQSGTWTVTPKADGTYSLFNGTNYLGYVAGNEHNWVPRIDTYTSDEDESTHWRFLTKDDLAKTLEQATADNPVDATFYISAPEFLIGDQRIITSRVWGNDVTGTGGNVDGASTLQNCSNGEVFNKTPFDVRQTLTGIPNGIYSLSVQGFYRLGSNTNAAAAYNNRNHPQHAELYAGSQSTPLLTVYDAAKKSAQGGWDYSTAAGYVPNNQAAAAACFDAGNYTVTLHNVTVMDGTLTIGIRKSQGVENDWTCFDNFTLLYYGSDLSKTKKAALQQVDDYEKLNTDDNAAYAASLSAIRSDIENAGDEAQVMAALESLKPAYSLYRSATEVDATAIDLTDLIANADFGEGTKGWEETLVNNPGFSQKWSSNIPTTPAAVEAYAGFGELELTDYALTQQLTLSPGMYELDGYAFYRYGTSYNSDITGEGQLHSYAYLFAGDDAVKVKRLGDINADTYANNMNEASAEFAKGNYLNRLVFTLTDSTKLTIGFKGEHTRYRSWFIAGPVKLRKINEQILEEELAQDFNYVKEQYAQRWDSYQAISDQATDHEDFDKLLLAAHESLKDITTQEELDAKDAEMSAAIRQFIKTAATATGRLDITPLIVNASFDRNTDGWTSGQTIGWNSNGVAEIFGYEAAKVEQVLKDMPAGEYTLKVQTFYRPTTYGTSSRGYEAGTIDNRGVFFFGNNSQGVKDINDDARYLSANPFGDVAGAYNKVIPDNLTGVDAAFRNGQYWNVMRTMLAADGDVSIGLSYDNALGFCWMPFDNFRLYYGTPVQDITLSETDLFDIHEDTYANVTMDKVLKAGQYNSLCLPFDVPATEFESVWTLAGVSFDEESQALTGTLIPAQEVKAGMPYFVRVATDKPLHFDNVLVRAFPPDSVPVIWEGAALQGTYGRTFLRRTYSLDETGQLVYMPSKLNAPGYFVQVNLSADIFRKADVINLKEIDYQDVDFTINMENIQIRDFLANAKYGSSAAASIVEGYRRCPPGRRDQPHTVILPVPPTAANARLTVRYATSEDFSDATTQSLKAGAAQYELRNLMPQTDYYFELRAGSDVVSRGHFFTEGRLRMIKVNSVSNVRDLGGWLTADGQRVRYGLIYRGGEMNAGHVMTDDDKQELLRLGIGAEVDLREDIDIAGANITGSAFGDDVPYIYINQNRWNEDALELDVEKYKNVFNLILDNLRKGKAVYFHCIWGADRTGALAFLLEGLMGLTPDQMYKDYELTSFSIAGTRKKEGLDAKFTYLNGKYTGKQQDRFLAYWRDEVGIPEADLKDFIRIMVGDGTADGIEQTTIGRQADMAGRTDGRIYDLTGRSMGRQCSHLPQGIYIKDGKKFVVK